MQNGLSRVEREILDYLRDKAGSSKADIIRHMRDKQLASRMTVLEYIKDLENKDMIYGRKERPNSQKIMMFVKEDSELVRVLTELEEFKDAYFRLLEKSREKINNKDYSDDAKALGITETDPIRWTPSDMMRHIGYEKARIEHDLLSVKEFHRKTSDRIRKLSDLEGRMVAISEMYDRLENPDLVKNHAIRQQISSDIRSEVTKVKSEIEGGILSPIREPNVYTSIYFLADTPIKIFYLLNDIILFRSTLMWPKIVSNKDILLTLYSMVYTKIAEIQIRLTEFLTTTKLGLILLDPTRYMTMIKRVQDYNTEETFIPDIITYGKFEMQPEIRKVLDSLIKLNEEIKELEYLDFARIGEFISAYYKEYNEVEIRDLLRKADEFISNLPPS